jgi:gliding motility-associated-like protein
LGKVLPLKRTVDRGFLHLAIAFTLIISSGSGQNCDVDFPGASIKTYSLSCGTTCQNLNLGKNTPLGVNDIFVFDLPIISITGNVSINAEGGGKIIIPLGVTVNINGNFKLDSKNSGCNSNNPCMFEMEVHGTLNLKHNFDNDVTSLVWTGTGNVHAEHNFKNSSNGCMKCGVSGCPTLNVNASDCKDDGVNCGEGDFCNTLIDCIHDITPPQISGCPTNITTTITDACGANAAWDMPIVEDNCSQVTLTSTHKPGDMFFETTTVTYTATDVSENVSSCTFDVVLVDETIPVISNCPGDILIEAGDRHGAIVEWIEPTASTLCGNVTFIASHRSGDNFPFGHTQVTYKAINDRGNSTYCSFNVTVSEPEVDVTVAGILTPDGNGINDIWTLMNIERFKDNKVVVVDRWGGLIFQALHYDNERVVWRGTNRSGGLVPTGTYFYDVFIRTASSTIHRRGSVEVVR